MSPNATRAVTGQERNEAKQNRTILIDDPMSYFSDARTCYLHVLHVPRYVRSNLLYIFAYAASHTYVHNYVPR